MNGLAVKRLKIYYMSLSATHRAAAHSNRNFSVPPVRSPYSVLSVLTFEERRELRSQNYSFHRRAKVPPGLPPQAVPRHIVQTGFTYARALEQHSEWMRSWLDLNPEYEYSFFGDKHALRFMERHGSVREAAAYRRILTGSQRADLFRVVFLKVAGGVYADLDEELRRPMSELIGGRDFNQARVPRSASAVIGTFWPFEFLVFAPQHPIMIATAKHMSDDILRHVELQRQGSKDACKTPHECVIRITGPLAYTSGVGDATHAPNTCVNRVRTPRKGQCDTAASLLLRSIHICENDQGTIWNSWSCGFARHWVCVHAPHPCRLPLSTPAHFIAAGCSVAHCRTAATLRGGGIVPPSIMR